MKSIFQKFVTTFALIAMTTPAFATTPDLEVVDPNQDTAELALERGLVPADMLDSSDYQVDYANEEADSGLVDAQDSLYQRRPGPGRPGPGRPGPGPGRPGPGRPGPGRPERPPRRPQPPPRSWQCEARDRAGYIYQGRDWDLQQARRDAVRSCERRTRSGGCRLLGCR